ncbi:hypothetical protein [Williamsia herbipolensis]|uniref:hypothetical protein n=1 Tax=Williamsia herbipolensis TaxID=1603258 RepID=UPI000AFE8F9C|nr:hypothetical protein [Williamsia herbipolensis]
MSDTIPQRSLALRAKKLTALARVKREGLGESQFRGQVQTALNRLDQELLLLEAVLKVYRKLKDIGAPVDDLIDLQQPARRLQEQAELGRPTAQFLQARCRDLDTARSAIDLANMHSWRTWASEMIASLPVSLLPRVNFVRRDATKMRISELQKLAAKKPSIPDIIQFSIQWDRVKDEFDEVGDASIDSLLKRFNEGQVRLADLSDEELATLRGDASLNDQLYISIRS